jgi:CubicO group peptidase (beta-lactamase class C family)
MRTFTAAICSDRSLALPARSPAVPPAVDPATIDRILDKALAAWQVPGVACAVVCNDRVIYLGGRGVKELGRKDPVTPDTLFPIASCTKAFTTTAMAMLVDEGKLAWDDPVRKHLDYFRLADPLADCQVTLRDLVTHRTGVAPNDLLWYRAPWTQEQVVRKIGLVKPSRSFRSSFQYQSTMYTAAGLAVAATARTPWADLVRRRILDPLDMRETVLTTAAAENAADCARPHRLNAQGQLEVIPSYRMEVPDPAGSIASSARDLANWARFHLAGGTFDGKRLVSAEGLGETHTPQNLIRLEGQARAMNPDTLQMSYGMGWVIQDYRGQLEYAHGGVIDGFRAHITLLPKEGVGIVLLNNRHQTWMNLAVCNTLVDLLLGLPPKDWNNILQGQVREEEVEAEEREREAKRQRGTHPPCELAAYAGTYEEPAYGTADLTLEHGRLVLHWSTFTLPLHHFHHDTFVADSDLLGSPVVQFALGPDGDVATMHVDQPLGVEFKKRRSRKGLSGRPGARTRPDLPSADSLTGATISGCSLRASGISTNDLSQRRRTRHSSGVSEGGTRSRTASACGSSPKSAKESG